MPNVVQSADVRMIQAGDSPSFTLEPFSQFRAISKMRRQNLDGDDSVQAGIFSAVNLAHPARTNSGENFVAALDVCR